MTGIALQCFALLALLFSVAARAEGTKPLPVCIAGQTCGPASQANGFNKIFNKNRAPKGTQLVFPFAGDEAWWQGKTEYQMHMWKEVTALMENLPVEPREICNAKPNLCTKYKQCVDNAKSALDNGLEKCALPSQAAGLKFLTPTATQREKKCAAIVLVEEASDPASSTKAKQKTQPVAEKPAADPGSDPAPVAGNTDGGDSNSTPDLETPAAGSHDNDEPAKSSKTRTLAEAPQSLLEGCGDDAGRLARRMKNGKLLPHSVYQITVQVENGQWVPTAKDSGKDTQCLRVMTDSLGGIRGRAVLSATANGDIKNRIRSRFLGRQLSNARGKIEPNRHYDPILFPDGNYRFLASACDTNENLEKPFVMYVQTSPNSETMDIVGLKFTGKRSDPPNQLSFDEVLPDDVKAALADNQESSGVTGTGGFVSMAVFAPDPEK